MSPANERKHRASDGREVTLSGRGPWSVDTWEWDRTHEPLAHSFHTDRDEADAAFDALVADIEAIQ
jgi:hypothetical protein